MSIDYNIITEEEKRLKELHKRAYLEYCYTVNPKFIDDREYIDLNNIHREQLLAIQSSLADIRSSFARWVVFQNVLRDMIQSCPIFYGKLNDTTIMCDRLYRDEHGDFVKGYLCVGGYIVECPVEMSLNDYIGIYVPVLKNAILREFNGDEKLFHAVCEKVIADSEMVTDEMEKGGRR